MIVQNLSPIYSGDGHLKGTFEYEVIALTNPSLNNNLAIKVMK